MKNYLLPIMFILVVFTLLVGCATTKLDDYKPTSTDEEEIVQVMIRARNAWDKSDESGFIAEFCPEGEFAYRATGTNRGDKRKVSKDKISTIFSASHTSMGYYENIENPKISIAGDKAKFSAENNQRHRWPIIVLLLRENGKWCINDWDFNLNL